MKRLFILVTLIIVSVSDCSKGECIEGNCENGKGTYVRSDGAIYIGEWKNGKRDGYGVEDSEENNYDGYFKENYWDGKGKWIWKTTNMVYEGTFKKGELDGIGKQIDMNGTIYIGNFIEGKAEGYGEVYEKNGNIFKGQFKNDRRYGHGILVFGDKKRKRRIGNWYNGSFCVEGDCLGGYGKVILPKSYSYEGNLKEGWPEGKGILKDKEGKVVHEGEFRNGNPIKG